MHEPQSMYHTSQGGPGEEPASQAAEGKAIVATQKYPSQKGVAEEEEEPGEEDEMAAGGKLKRMKTGEEGEEEDEEQQEGEEKVGGVRLMLMVDKTPGPSLLCLQSWERRHA